MITKQELLIKRDTARLPLPTVEKDYILGLILSCIYRHPVLKKDWIFKGGTCLKKLYLADYRFSEDLDFSLTENAAVDPQIIESYLLECCALAENLFGLHLDKTHININPFPDKNGLFIQIKIPFQSPLMPVGSLPKIKMDISKNERLVDGPVYRSLLHPYSDQEPVVMPVLCYSIEEIFAEKCRALVERTRPRDLYDVVHIYETFFPHALDWDKFQHIAFLKFQFKSLRFPHDLLNISETRIQEAQEAWDDMLAHQIYPLDAIDNYIARLKPLMKNLVPAI